MSNTDYQVGQLVNVEARLWAGINRPGGIGRITKVDYCQHGYVETVDVKYIVGSGSDTKVDLEFIQPHKELERTSRSRRGRDLFSASPARATTTTTPAEHTEHGTNTKRRKVSPSPGRGLGTSKTTSRTKNKTKSLQQLTAKSASRVTKIVPDDLPTITRASTVRMTLGSELPQVTINKVSTSKPPVPFVIIPQNPQNVSPLYEGIASSKNENKNTNNCKDRDRPVASKKFTDTTVAARPSQFIKRPVEAKNPEGPSHESQSQARVLNLPATVEMKTKFAACKSPLRQFKLPLAASRRVPLRQVFDNDMNIRQTFVNDVVGESSMTKAPAVATDTVVNQEYVSRIVRVCVFRSKLSRPSFVSHTQCLAFRSTNMADASVCSTHPYDNFFKLTAIR